MGMCEVWVREKNADDGIQAARTPLTWRKFTHLGIEKGGVFFNQHKNTGWTRASINLSTRLKRAQIPFGAIEMTIILTHKSRMQQWCHVPPQFLGFQGSNGIGKVPNVQSTLPFDERRRTLLHTWAHLPPSAPQLPSSRAEPLPNHAEAKCNPCCRHG